MTYDDSYPATEADAHAEWHRNTRVPMGQPGCPQDACDGEPEDIVPGCNADHPTRPFACALDAGHDGPHFDSGREWHDGPVCPACGRIAYWHQGGHTVGCRLS